jgi:MFS family permease
MIGSVLCAAAQSWEMLLVGRALQGLGAAGIMSLSRIILSDGATLAENSKANSVLSLIAGCSYAVGPIIGGYLADASWRYIFVLPIGVAVLAMVMIFFLMRKELVQGRAISKAGESRRLGYISGLAIIDWPGLVMFILGVGLIILAVQWGGTQYAWRSAAVIAPFILGAMLCIAFFGYEYLLGPGRAVARMFPQQVPMIPSTLFRKKDTAILMIINFSAGISMVSAFYFISYYWQLAEGYVTSMYELHVRRILTSYTNVKVLFQSSGYPASVLYTRSRCGSLQRDDTLQPLATPNLLSPTHRLHRRRPRSRAAYVLRIHPQHHYGQSLPRSSRRRNWSTVHARRPPCSRNLVNTHSRHAVITLFHASARRDHRHLNDGCDLFQQTRHFSWRDQHTGYRRLASYLWDTESRIAEQPRTGSQA